MALIDFTLSNARRFYSSMGNPLGWKALIMIITRQDQRSVECVSWGMYSRKHATYTQVSCVFVTVLIILYWLWTNSCNLLKILYNILVNHADTYNEHVVWQDAWDNYGYWFPTWSQGKMDPLQLSDHLVQNRQTGEQMTHWDMLNKATTKFEVSLFNMSQWVICSPVWQFCTTWSLSIKGPIPATPSINQNGI